MVGGMYKALLSSLRFMFNALGDLIEALRSRFCATVVRSAQSEREDENSASGANPIKEKKTIGHSIAAQRESISQDVTSITHIHPDTVWNGETGPELPQAYQITTLQAMPCDSSRVFLYWEIAESDLQAIAEEEGDSFLQEAVAVLRIHIHGDLDKEVQVDLDKSCIYLTLHDSGLHEFELVFKHSPVRERSLIRSNTLTLPTDHPSRSLLNEEMGEQVDTNGTVCISRDPSASLSEHWLNGSGGASIISSHFSRKSTG